ncbi:protoporphyrinogen oxidase [Cellulomonas triticagri]|uniref:Protoporphyrinogen oxidase n=1 Tax=Cellulomonas triticagri TaxID=2483352 RepID=A0A3M2ITA4_9CELL|nr:protoporphyrinogen oxidase [Cellulomonas triticagri]
MQILVTVASRHGATAEIGTAVADVLRADGHVVDEVEPEEVADLTGYDAVVLGSAVYTAHWLPAARDLAARLAPQLRERVCWVFSSGLATQPAASANSPHELRVLMADIRAVGHRAFAGRLRRADLAFAERAIIAGARAKEGDHRDFDAVRAWAGQIADELRARAGSVTSTPAS